MSRVAKNPVDLPQGVTATVADGVVIGAGSVVTRDLTVRGIYAGNPARLIRAL